MENQENKILDPYAILGVSKDAEDEEIKRAYRRLSLKCHPDLYPEKQEEFVRLNQAYEMINTEEKRRQLRLRSGVTLSKGALGAVKSFFDKMFKIEGGEQ